MSTPAQDESGTVSRQVQIERRIIPQNPGMGDGHSVAEELSTMPSLRDGPPFPDSRTLYSLAFCMWSMLKGFRYQDAAADSTRQSFEADCSRIMSEAPVPSQNPPADVAELYEKLCRIQRSIFDFLFGTPDTPVTLLVASPIPGWLAVVMHNPQGFVNRADVWLYDPARYKKDHCRFIGGFGPSNFTADKDRARAFHR